MSVKFGLGLPPLSSSLLPHVISPLTWCRRVALRLVLQALPISQNMELAGGGGPDAKQSVKRVLVPMASRPGFWVHLGAWPFGIRKLNFAGGGMTYGWPLPFCPRSQQCYLELA